MERPGERERAPRFETAADQIDEWSPNVGQVDHFLSAPRSTGPFKVAS